MNIGQRFKELISLAFRALGYRLTRIDPVQEMLGPGCKYEWLKNMNVNTVLDAGAYTGQAASAFHKILPSATIYSFEPLADCYEKLNATMAGVTQFKSFNLALGDRQDQVRMNRSAFAPSSSLLRMAGLHKDAFPFSAGETAVMVNVTTLDEMAPELDLKENILLKIDVQGYEDRVLRGALSIIDRIRVIIVETSFSELYEGQPLFSAIHNLLSGHGFVYSGSWDQLAHPVDGLPLQQDSIFIRGSRADS